MDFYRTVMKTLLLMTAISFSLVLFYRFWGLDITDSQNLIISKEWPKYGFLAASSAVLLILTTLCLEGARVLFLDDNPRVTPYMSLELVLFISLTTYCYQVLSTTYGSGVNVNDPFFKMVICGFAGLIIAWLIRLFIMKQLSTR